MLNELGPEALGFEFAAESDPDRLADGPSYIVAASESNIQQMFLKKGSFESELLCYSELITHSTLSWSLSQANRRLAGRLQISRGRFR